MIHTHTDTHTHIHTHTHFELILFSEDEAEVIQDPRGYIELVIYGFSHSHLLIKTSYA